MPVTEKKYPEWVQKFRTKGKTVKKKGDTYYLYSRTSKRVAGKKYPQPVDTYIGIITPDGIIESDKKKVSLSDIEVWEYGFSMAIAALCPEGWKKALGADWEEVMKIIVCDWSDASCFRMEEMREKEEFRYQFGAQAGALMRRILKEHGVSVKELAPLKKVFVVKIGKKKVLSKIDPEQQELLNRIGLKLEVD